EAPSRHKRGTSAALSGGFRGAGKTLLAGRARALYSVSTEQGEAALRLTAPHPSSPPLLSPPVALAPGRPRRAGRPRLPEAGHAPARRGRGEAANLRRERGALMPPPAGRLWSRFATITRPFFRSEQRWRALALLGLILLFIFGLNALNVLGSF